MKIKLHFMIIKELIKARGMTAKEVAASAGVTEAMLSNIASGKGNPSLHSLKKIAEALGVSVSELFETTANEEATVVCPHCGKPIKLHVEQ